ncbi:MAG: hypothetical protein A2136_08290 [Chloroflexi bacterium RBG_16_54_11]|nr:MAG: hypothetical protein A2136_08290 [Chloroflexi bacterium RBG_16_54_11]
MRAHRLNLGHTLYWLAFLLALFLRLFKLGAGPLSDAEANLALQALGLTHGGGTSLGAQPAYLVLTSQLFSIFGDTNFLARLYPALAGGLLVWLPFLLRRWTVTSPWLQRLGLVMAFGLALDPGLVSLSRQVGSPMPALAFSLLSLASFYNRRLVWTGIFAGLALLSGPAFPHGLLVLGISLGFYRLLGQDDTPPVPGEDPAGLAAAPLTSKSISIILSAFAATLLVAGVLFLRLPEGVSVLAGTIPAYLDSWVKPSGIPLLRLPGSLLVYQPLALVFALVAMLRALFGHWDDPSLRRVLVGLGIWAGVALLVPLLYAGRQVGDLAWALVPLWALAAAEISRALAFEQDRLTHLVAAALGLLLFVLSVVGWFNLLSIGRYQVNEVVYWAIIIGALLLGFIAVLLVAATWSSAAAGLGVVWAVCVVLGLGLISNTWGMSLVRQNSAQDLWSPPAATGQAGQLDVTLSDLSSWNTGLKDQLEIVSLVDSPALRWALRHYPNARFEALLSPAVSPPVVITLKGSEPPLLAEKYRGQDFVWWLYPGWRGVFPPDIINWLAFHQAPLAQEQVILWARADIFPGGASGAAGDTAP